MDLKNYRPAANLLNDRVILVTGASGGIGRTVATTLAAHGATVVLHGRDVGRLEAVYDAIEAAGATQPAIVPLDFTDAGDRQFDNMALAIEGQLRRLDGIVYCHAHLAHLGPLQEQTVDEWMKHLRVNLATCFGLTRACTHLLRAAPDATVVVTIESHALKPAAYWGSYTVAQSGLLAFCRIQAQEWAQSENLRINVLVPGIIDSPQRARTHPGESPASRAPLETILPAYLYLVGPDSRGVSGKVFTVQP